LSRHNIRNRGKRGKIVMPMLRCFMRKERKICKILMQEGGGKKRNERGAKRKVFTQASQKGEELFLTGMREGRFIDKSPPKKKRGRDKEC